MVTPPPPPTGAASSQVGFFRRYNRTIGWAYTALFAGLLGFFAFDLRQDMDKEIEFIESQVERHGQFLEFVLRSSSDHVETLRMALEQADPALACARGRRQATQGELQPSGEGFQRAALADPDRGANLMGTGLLADRSETFYCDLGAALGLDLHWQALSFHSPQVSGVRFLSVHGFDLRAPWRAATQVTLEDRSAANALWWRGQPAANPQRLKYWAPPYFGGPEAGLLVPVAAPVHDGDRFMGVVAVDISQDHLHRINSGFAYPLGVISAVDAQGHVLASPRLFPHPLPVQASGRLEEIGLPGPLAASGALAELPQGRAVEVAGTVVIRRAFPGTPWQLVYTVPRATLWGKLLPERGASMIKLLLALVLLMAITYRVTSREFVAPAAMLVGHVASESSFQPQPIPQVPPAWRPWFEAITRAFSESVQLGSLRNELDIAARMQQSLLPRQWPQDPRFTLWGTMVPAKDIGGDFFDHFPLPEGRCGMVVADVSGKGIPAGLFGMLSKTLLRAVATQGDLPPGGVTRQVNETLCVDNEGSMFVTTFYGQYDPASGRLVYANAGHPPPLVLRAGGQAQWLASTGGTALGVAPHLTYQERSIDLEPGDTLLIFTDGVTEAIDPKAQEFGAWRLAALFERRETALPRQMIDHMLRAVRDFSQGAEQFDDITCMALQCHRLGAVG